MKYKFDCHCKSITILFQILLRFLLQIYFCRFWSAIFRSKFILRFFLRSQFILRFSLLDLCRVGNVVAHPHRLL